MRGGMCIEMMEESCMSGMDGRFRLCLGFLDSKPYGSGGSGEMKDVDVDVDRLVYIYYIRVFGYIITV
jgi:hypothetical protein